VQPLHRGGRRRGRAAPSGRSSPPSCCRRLATATRTRLVSPGRPGAPRRHGAGPVTCVEDDLPRSTGSTAFGTFSPRSGRIVQGALTNVRKHAPGARVTVRVRYEPAQVRVEIRNSALTRPGRCRAWSVPAPASASAASAAHRPGRRLAARRTHPRRRFLVDATLPAYVPTADSMRNSPGGDRWPSG
jgi:hypothetical protein